MSEIKNVLICGIGAIGAIYANKLLNCKDVTLRVLVDERRMNRYTKNPIAFNGQAMDLRYALPSDEEFKADLIIISTKFSGLQDAIVNIKNFVKPDSIIISLLNGVTSEDLIAQVYGKDKILYSYFIGHSSVRVGNLISHDDVNTIVFGSDVKCNSNVQRLQAFWDKCNISYKVSDDIKRSLWLKFMLNVAANQTTAILKMTFGEMLRNKTFMNFAENVMSEVQQIAKAEGVNNSETMILETIEHLKTMSPDGKTSMLQDIESGRKTEVKMFAGTIIDLGVKHNIPTPYNTVLSGLINILEEDSEIKKSLSV